MENNLERLLTIRLTSQLRDKIDVVRKERPDKPRREDIIIELLEKSLAHIQVKTRFVKGKAKSYEFLPHELVKLERGEYMGMLPFGYKVEVTKRTSRYTMPGTVHVDPTEAKILLSLFENYATGKFSTDAIQLYLYLTFQLRKSRSNINAMLKNKFYIGIMTWRGKEFPHKYPQLIPAELFERAQEVRLFNNRYSLLGDVKPADIPKSVPKPTIADPFLDLFKNLITFDQLQKETKLPPMELRQKLLDYEVNGLIEEMGPSTWIIKR